jgi:hypothetical protein
MTLFSRYQKPLWRTVETVMGDVATWQPSAGGALQTATILFNEPSETQERQSFDYEPARPKMEWRVGQFQGLAEATRAGAVEVVTIRGRRFAVAPAKLRYDGATYEAELEAE